jgi:hypothetical protein
MWSKKDVTISLQSFFKGFKVLSLPDFKTDKGKGK